MNETVSVWFEGLGLDAFSLNKIALSLFDTIEVRWYGIFITFGIVLAFLYACLRGKKSEGIIPDDVLDIGLFTVLFGVIGARAYYVLTSLDDFHSFYEMIAIWNGGLAIYGGIIGGCIGIVSVCAFKHIDWKRAFDMIVPGVILAQVIGRWGNFFNGEAYGSMIGETTQYFFFLKEFQLPSGEGTFFHLFRMGLYPNDINPFFMVFVHPTFLYEGMWNLLGFLLLNIVYRHKRYNGQIMLLYFTWYGFGRMLIEGFRTDSLYILQGVVSEEGLRVSQCVGAACFVVGSILLLCNLRTRSLKLSDFVTVKETPALAYPPRSEEELAQAEEEADARFEDMMETKLEESADRVRAALEENSAENPEENSAESPEESDEAPAQEELTDGNEN